MFLNFENALDALDTEILYQLVLNPILGIKDLSNDAIYEVIELVEVTIPVTMGETEIEVPCTAVYGKVL